MRMMDQTAAFPRKVLVNQYKALIDGAVNAALGADHLPRAVVEDFDSYKSAVRAANAIRKYSQDNQLSLRVSCPEGQKTIYVYKSATPVKKRERVRKPSTLPIEETSVPAPASPEDVA